MSPFFKNKTIDIVLFSPLKGVMTYNGKPAVGAKIKRHVSWKDTRGETDEFTVDSKGHFSLPVKMTEYKDNPLVQLSIGQEVTVEYEGKQILIWRGGKSSSHLYGELGGEAIDVTCELTDEELDAHLEYALIETLCKWKKFKAIEEK